MKTHGAMIRLPALAGALAVGVCVLMGPAQAQQSTLEQTLEQYGEENVRGYIQPLADLFGANLNSGFYATARIPRARLTFGLELVGMGALVEEAQRVYVATTPEGFTPTSAETATVLGERGATVTHSQNPSLQYRFSDGLITADALPFAAPQVRIGGILGTEALVRYFPIPEIDDDFPSGQLLAYGLRHSISQYFPLLPVDVAVGAFVSQFTWGDYIDVSAATAGVQVSRDLPFLTVYGGGAWERSKTKLSYTSTEPGAEGEVSVELTGANSGRVTGGLALRLGPMTLFGDANLGAITNFSGGLRLGF